MTNQNPTYSTREAVGDKLYFWRNAYGEDRCLISAHGAYHSFSGKFSPSNISAQIQINFYVPHGRILADPGLGVMDGGYQPEPSHDAEIVNYRLSKYQTKKGESYGYIDKKIKIWENDRNTLDEYMQRLNGNPVPDHERTMIANAQAAQADVMRCHIVTVRNRDPFGILLESLIRQIHRHAQVTRFYCCFCRSHLLNPLAKVQTARRRR